MSSTRPYLIHRRDGTGSPRLIEAGSPASVLRHVALETFTVKAATGREVAALMRKGVALETAGEETPSAPPAPAAEPTPAPDAFLQGMERQDANDAASEALDAALSQPDSPVVPQREDDAPADPEDGSAQPSWERSNGDVYEAILLIDADWTGFGENDVENMNRIAAWSYEEAFDVLAFCEAVHRNPDIIPVRPNVIGGPLPGQVEDPQ